MGGIIPLKMQTNPKKSKIFLRRANWGMWLDAACYLVIKRLINHGDKLCTNTDDSQSGKMSLTDLMSSKQRLTL